VVVGRGQGSCNLISHRKGRKPRIELRSKRLTIGRPVQPKAPMQKAISRFTHASTKIWPSRRRCGRTCLRAGGLRCQPMEVTGDRRLANAANVYLRFPCRVGHRTHVLERERCSCDVGCILCGLRGNRHLDHVDTSRSAEVALFFRDTGFACLISGLEQFACLFPKTATARK
jgi:hypothetical protein